MKFVPFKRYALASFSIFSSIGLISKTILMDEPVKAFMGIIPLISLKSAIIVNCSILFLLSLIFYGLIAVWY